MTARSPRPATWGHLAAALAGLLLGGCSGTLHDAAGMPPHAPGGTTCDAPQHVCADACVAQSVTACGAACTDCTTVGIDPNATHTCEASAGGSYACGQACDAGWLACSSGCCRASAVAAGNDHACAVTSDGGLTCWGKNDAGQLGPAAAGLARSERPITVFASGVTAVAAGGRHTCAVQDGLVRCWGANQAGQLGDGTSSAAAAIVSTGLPGATALALGASHSCAMVGSGAAAAVWCWGANAAGQLGTGDLTPHAAPFPSLVTAGATALSAAGDSTCAVAAGAARCWGIDVEGQTGSGDTSSPRPPKPTPQLVPLPGPALQVAVGRKHACANASSGGGTPLSCWGSGGEGELGNGSAATPVLAPVQASTIDNGQKAGVFTAGEAFTCTAKAGEVSMNCNGRNDQAQCGVAPSSSPVFDRIDVSFGGAVLSASAGRAFTCALVDLAGVKVVKCWGANADGQLGRATPSSAPSPTPDLVGS